MNLKTLAPLKVFLLSIFIISQFSCSKDSDLITDYVLSETQNTLDISELILDDTFFITSKTSITLDVLANDGFENEQVVMITETSEPENGTVVINTDNTLTYTPNNTVETTEEVEDTTEEIEDTFTYTTEVVNEDDTVSSGTGNVTVTSENKTPISGDNVYYVTVNGKSNNDGRSESSSWNIQHAFATAVAGDVIYIKAGNYGATTLTTGHSGIDGNPIKFIGYTTTPGDIVASTWSTYSYEDYDADGGYLPSDIMPLIKGTDLSPEWADIAITIDDEYIWIENFMVERFSHGFRTTANHTTLVNCYSNLAGNWDPSNAGWNAPYSVNPPSGNLRGYGFANNESGNYFTIKNSTVFNAGADAIFITYGDDHIGEYNSVYTDRSGNASDYLYVLWESDRAQLTHNRAYRFLDRDTGADLPHHSRGLANSGSFNCVIDDFYIYNTRLTLQKGASNNTYKNVVMEGTSETFTGAVVLENACESNLFINTKIKNGYLEFNDWGEGSYVYEEAGLPNYFLNTVIDNTHNQVINKGFISIQNDAYNKLNSPMHSAGKQYFIGGSFANADYLFTQDRPVDNFVFKDITFSNVASGYISEIISGSPKTGNFTFSNCNFNNCNFTTPTNSSVVIPELPKN
ncbi:Ig-like domain-containing protein [Maribacter polysiphoniae]|uniref:Ig-like domain-containing protein n=1 Tax=Maribacter polysiphoniae TaxID=429344 RepID=UPI002355D365|nr:Ig-like domain-containing protein [Maribacter polysiphoniae]